MRATLVFLRERFEYYNSLCFDGRLPLINLRLSSSLRTLGTLRHPRHRTSSTMPSEITLSISNRLDLDTVVVEDTIIHEMIHLYIFWNKIKDTSVHGVHFRKIMNHINLTHGRHITVSHKGNTEEKKTDRLRKPRIVIVSQLQNGERCVTVCTPRYTTFIYGELQRSRFVSNCEIIVSYDSLFAHYPASRTPKIYKIESELLENVLKGCVFLDYKDGRLKPRS